MIYQTFFILEDFSVTGTGLPAGDDLYYSIRIDPAAKEALDKGYRQFAQSNIPLALTLEIREGLSEEAIRSITAFLFLPQYQQLEGRRVINLAGENAGLLSETAKILSTGLERQGFRKLLIQPISSEFRTVEELASHYRQLLQAGAPGQGEADPILFFHVPSDVAPASAEAALKEVEKEFRQHSPAMYTLLVRQKTFRQNLYRLKQELDYTAMELNNQRQYVEVLRSDHAARELQDYYTREYEVLPLWYKRVGHIVKVLTGKRTFRSLFRDDVKKYKD